VADIGHARNISLLLAASPGKGAGFSFGSRNNYMTVFGSVVGGIKGGLRVGPVDITRESASPNLF
jgi:hypothetical protein